MRHIRPIRIPASPLVLAGAFLALAATAAVPLRWTAETSRVQPARLEAVRGETLELEAAFTSYGRPLAMDGAPCAVYWQTNGMGSAYWVQAAAASGNVVRATFAPEMDPGAGAVRGFLGQAGENYRAAFAIRFLDGPGAAPNALPLPTKRIDFAAVEVANAPWLEEESDPTVPAWAKAASKPAYTASEVGATTPADVTAAIREQSLGGIWDDALQVWWTPRMRNGSLTYEATTNANLNAEN